MDFRELNYITAIAEEGNISRAADRLFIAQPTLSRFLQNHEKEIGIPLFQRNKGRLIPTYAGERYLDYAKQILHLSNQMDLELNDIAYEQKGRLNIACPRHRLDGIITLSILRFKKSFPQIEVNVLELNTEQRIQALADGSADIAIIYPSSPDPSMTYEPILKEEIILCIPPDHPLANTQKTTDKSKYPQIDIRHFNGEPFLLMPASTISGRVARNVFKSSGIQPKVIMETNNLNGILEAVSKGYGCAFIPDSFVHFSRITPLPQSFSLDDPNARIQLTAAYDPNAYHPKCMADFILILRETIFSKYQ